MNKGWITVNRKLMEKGYYKKSAYVHLWLHILLKANHEPNEWFYKNKTMKVNRGQFITSRKTLSNETGIEQNKVERILKCFENEHQIEQQNLYTSRLITIINYNQYQNIKQQNEQRVNSKRTANEQRVNTNNNDNNENKKDNLLRTENEVQKIVKSATQSLSSSKRSAKQDVSFFIEILKKIGIRGNRAYGYINDYDLYYLARRILLLEYRKTQGDKIERDASWLQTAIEHNGYDESDDYHKYRKQRAESLINSNNEHDKLLGAYLL